MFRFAARQARSSTALGGLSVATTVKYNTGTFVARSFSTDKSQEEILDIWQKADAVCFDVDCTITTKDGLDSLAGFLGKGEAVQKLTNAAMEGSLALEEALQRRLDIMEPTAEKITAWMKSNPAENRLAPGVGALLDGLKERDIPIYLISGGFRELILPVSDFLKVPRENIYANRFIFTASEDDPTTSFPQIKVHSFDRSEPTSREGGKPEVIRIIREQTGVKTVVMVGDGVTDLEAVQEEGGADLFVGYGGVVVRDVIKQNADWFVMDYDELTKALPP